MRYLKNCRIIAQRPKASYTETKEKKPKDIRSCVKNLIKILCSHFLGFLRSIGMRDLNLNNIKQRQKKKKWVWPSPRTFQTCHSWENSLG